MFDGRQWSFLGNPKERFISDSLGVHYMEHINYIGKTHHLLGEPEYSRGIACRTAIDQNEKYVFVLFASGFCLELEIAVMHRSGDTVWSD